MQYNLDEGTSGLGLDMDFVEECLEACEKAEIVAVVNI